MPPAQYLSQCLAPFEVSVTQIARGLPVGSDLALGRSGDLVSCAGRPSGSIKCPGKYHRVESHDSARAVPSRPVVDRSQCLDGVAAVAYARVFAVDFCRQLVFQNPRAARVHGPPRDGFLRWAHCAGATAL